MRVLLMVACVVMLAGCGDDSVKLTNGTDGHTHPGVKNSPLLAGSRWYQSDSKPRIVGSLKFDSTYLWVSTSNSDIFNMIGDSWLDGNTIYYHARDFKGADVSAYDIEDSAIITFSADGNNMTWQPTATTKYASYYPLTFKKMYLVNGYWQ